MPKQKNRNSGLKKKGLYFLILFFLLILVLTFFFGNNGIVEILHSRKKIENLKKNIELLKAKKAGLQKEIDELKRNPLVLEKRAREKLWLMKKNEKVVIFKKTSGKNTKKKR